MKDELYIDGQKVDMNKSGVNLTYRSNLLADLSKIVGNYSQTIKLPKTANNMRIIGASVLLSSDSYLPYIYHSGRLVRDGIVIVDKANVVLLSVGDNIEVSLTWGDSEVLRQFVSSEAKLADLDWNPSLEENAIVCKSTIDGVKDVPYIGWGVTINDDTPFAFYHPSIPMSRIITKIHDKYGIQVNVPNNRLSLTVPLTSQNVSPYNWDKSQIYEGLNAHMMSDNSYNVYFTMSEVFKTKRILITAPNSNYESSTIRALYKPCKVNVRYSIELRVSPMYGETPEDFTSSDSTYILLGKEVKPSFSYNETGNLIALSEGDLNEVDLSLEGVEFLRFWSQFTLNQEFTKINSYYIEITPIIEELRQGDTYFFDVNMPDVKLTDIIKTYMRMLGCYAKADGADITLESFSSVYDRKASAVDWSDKLLKTGVTPENMTFVVDDTAQVNNFKYKEDDKTVGNYDSYITIDSKTLEASRDAFTSAFAATDEVDTPSALSHATIPVYYYEEKDNGEKEFKYKDVKPRILSLRSQGAVWKGTFYGLDWATLINRYYDSYKRMITNAKIISETIRLTHIELKNLDMYTPIYLRQYGAYFAVLEIKTKDNNNNEVKLLKL